MSEYQIFVSYSRQDAGIVGPLVQLLRLTDNNVFRDTDNISPGIKWRTILVDAVDNCQTFLLFWCRHSSTSAAVETEFTRALRKKKVIVPLILDGTPLPQKLAEYQWIDLRPVMSGNHEGYRDIYIPGFMQGQTSREWGIIIPDRAILLEASVYLKNSLFDVIESK